MPLRHIALALLVVAIWGCNFVATKIGLREIPPLQLCAIRFLLAALPAALFVPRPTAPFGQILGFGWVMFTLQFALLFSGMRAGASAGLSSLLLQTQALFTVALAVAFLGERPSIWQMAGGLLSCSGIAVVVAHTGGDMSGLGLALIIAAAAAWGIGNLMTKRLGKVDTLALVVWGSLCAWPPLMLASLLLEAEAWNPRHLGHLSWSALGAVAYIVYPSTLLGYVGWSWLLKHYPAATVAPFTLMVPIFGFTGSALALGEAIHAWKIIAALLILAGLCINLFGARVAARRMRRAGAEQLR